MHRRARAVPVLVFAAALGAGCASTRLTSTWRDPSAPSAPFRKVVGLALTEDTTLRRVAEDAFVAAVAPAAIAGYTLVPDAEMRDRELVKARLEAAGADGAVVFRLVGVEEKQVWVPPTYYGSAWGYWDYAAPRVYQPGYLATDRIVQVETLAYRVADARLVWAARSETLNPKDAQALIDGVVDASVKAMREQKLLPRI